MIPNVVLPWLKTYLCLECPFSQTFIHLCTYPTLIAHIFQAPLFLQYSFKSFCPGTMSFVFLKSEKIKWSPLFFSLCFSMLSPSTEMASIILLPLMKSNCCSFIILSSGSHLLPSFIVCYIGVIHCNFHSLDCHLYPYILFIQTTKSICLFLPLLLFVNNLFIFKKV